MGEKFDIWFNNDELLILIEKAKTDEKTNLTQFIKRKALETVADKPKESIQEKRQRLQNEKLESDILLNKIRVRKELIHLGTTPSQAFEISEGRKKFEDVTESKTLTAKEWDNVYGCLIDVRHDSMNECIVCHDSFEKTETARKHIIENHPDRLQKIVSEVLKW